MEEPPWGLSLAFIYFLSSKLNKTTRQLYPSRKRILPHHGRHSRPISWGPPQPPVQPSSSVPPFRDVHVVIFLLSGLEAIICSPGTGSPARSQPCAQPSCRRQLFKFTMSTYTRLHQLPFPSHSQPTTPTFIFWSVPTKRCSRRKTRSKTTKATMTARQTHFLLWTM